MESDSDDDFVSEVKLQLAKLKKAKTAKTADKNVKKKRPSPMQRLLDVPFNELCQMYTMWLLSPETAQVYPDFIIDKHDRQNFKKRCQMFRYDTERHRLFRQFTNPLGQSKCYNQLHEFFSYKLHN